MEPGIASYEDVGQGKILVSANALNRMRDSFIGKPVVNRIHQDLSPEEAYGQRDKEPESWADGIVVNVGRDEQSGWDYADMMIWDEETQRNIDLNGYSVSCAYIPSETGNGGVWHGIEYDEEVLNGEYTHMAIVESPRYEGATIYENAKGEKQTMKFKLFSKEQKAAEPVHNSKENTMDEREEQTMNMDDAYVETEDGAKIPLDELVSAYKSQKDSQRNVLNMEDEVDVDGESVKVSELISAYQSANAVDPQDDDAEPVVDEAKQNGAVQNAKSNPENMKRVQKAVQNAEGDAPAPNISTRSDRIARGKARYSKTVPQGGSK